jgi:hypothetical protein
MDKLLALSILGTALSVTNNITPLLAIIQRARTKKLNELPKNYILINHFCQMFWICYSLRVRLFGLILVNSMTFLLSLANNLILNYFLQNLFGFLAIYLVLASIIIFTCFFVISVQLNGFICIVLGVSSTASILESIFKVFKTKNLRFIDLKIAFSLFGTGSVWMTYSILAKENNAFFTSSFSTIMGMLMIVTHVSFRLFLNPRHVSKIDAQSKYFSNALILV